MHFRHRNSLSNSRAARQSALRPVPLQNIAIQDSFWSPKLETYRTNSIEAGWSNNTIKTALDLLDRSARGDISSTPVKCGWSRGCINEANLGKHLEAVAYCLAQWPDAQMQTRYEEAIATVQKGQRADGWMYAFGIVGKLTPWQCLCMQHEGYTVGHYYEAAAAHYETTGKEAFLNAAVKSADQACTTFLGANAREGFPGHAGIEPALARLYRANGKQEYLDLARRFVEKRGRVFAPDQGFHRNIFRIIFRSVKCPR